MYLECNSEFFNAENRDNSAELCKTNLEKYLYDTFTRQNKFNVDFDLHKEFEKVFDKYCPSYGTADTVYGEILRGINKLIYRYLNDGDDIECGPYSGIWVGLHELNCPFTYGDASVVWDYDYPKFDDFGMTFSDHHRDFNLNLADNMIINALILESFNFKDMKNDLDISNYYKNITEFIVNDKIIDAFQNHNLNITDNMGAYAANLNGIINGGYDFEINSIGEDLYIKFNNGQRNIKIEFFTQHIKFELEFNVEDIDKVLDEYAELLKILFQYAKYDFRKPINMEDWEKNLNVIGFKFETDGHVKKIVKA